MLSISLCSKPYWKPGIFGVPRIMNVRTASSGRGLSPRNRPSSGGPMVGPPAVASLLFSKMGRWHTEQFCMNKPFPVFCCSFRVGTALDDDEDWLDCAARTIGKICPDVRSNTQATLENKLIAALPYSIKMTGFPLRLQPNSTLVF